MKPTKQHFVVLKNVLGCLSIKLSTVVSLIFTDINFGSFNKNALLRIRRFMANDLYQYKILFEIQ